MSGADLGPTSRIAAEMLIASEEAHRGALQRQALHQAIELLLERARQLSDVKLAEKTALVGMTLEERAAFLAARAATGQSLDQREALALEERLMGRECVMLEEAEAYSRLQLTILAERGGMDVAAAFRSCVRVRYDYVRDMWACTPLPVKPEVAAQVCGSAQRHLPVFKREEARASQEWYRELRAAERASGFSATLDGLAIKPPTVEERQPPLTIEDGHSAIPRIAA